MSDDDESCGQCLFRLFRDGIHVRGKANFDSCGSRKYETLIYCHMGKFGINAKAAEGRERKKAAAEAKEHEKQAVKEAKEAQEWQVGAKSNAKKEAEEAKRLEKLAKKKERDLLEAEETASIKSVSSVKSQGSVSKKTQFELLMRPPTTKAPSSLNKTSIQEHPMEPLNRPSSTVSTEKGSIASVSEYSASNLDDAIALLDATNLDTDKLTLDRHPERRVKAAYTVFEQAEMPLLKLENPGLRLSQLRQLLKKKWDKSPTNPLNQASISYRASREEELEAVKAVRESQLDRFKSG